MTEYIRFKKRYRFISVFAGVLLTQKKLFYKRFANEQRDLKRVIKFCFTLTHKTSPYDFKIP